MPLSRRYLLRPIASGVAAVCAPHPGSEDPTTDTDTDTPDVVLIKART